MKRRNPKIHLIVDGSRWTMMVDRDTGMVTLRQHNKRSTCTIPPSRIVELAVGQKVMPFAEAIRPAPKREPTEWEKTALAKHPVGHALLQATGNIPVQTTFA